LCCETNGTLRLDALRSSSRTIKGRGLRRSTGRGAARVREVRARVRDLRAIGFRRDHRGELGVAFARGVALAGALGGEAGAVEAVEAAGVELQALLVLRERLAHLAALQQEVREHLARRQQRARAHRMFAERVVGVRRLAQELRARPAVLSAGPASP
jgi:hypothetical protein